jgi:hypothetical protein
MIVHHNEAMQKKSLGPAAAQHFDKEFCPAFIAKEGGATRGIGGHEVCLSVAGRDFPIWPHTIPSGAKAPVCSVPLRRG